MLVPLVHPFLSLPPHKSFFVTSVDFLVFSTIVVCRNEDILNYLGQFGEMADQMPSGHGCVHPVSMVMEQFKTPKDAEHTLSRLHTFLEEVHKVTGRTFEESPKPASRWKNMERFPYTLFTTRIVLFKTMYC